MSQKYAYLLAGIAQIALFVPVALWAIDTASMLVYLLAIILVVGTVYCLKNAIALQFKK